MENDIKNIIIHFYVILNDKKIFVMLPSYIKFENHDPTSIFKLTKLGGNSLI
jgi:hypothetical protein